MAIPVARVHLAMAHASLPGLLPTPPASPLLTASRLLILPAKSPFKPSRADSNERWDARKIATKPPAKPGRADSDERWDAHKIKPATTSSSSSSSRSSTTGESTTSSPRWKSSDKRPLSGAGASSAAERWDAHKKPRPPLHKADAVVEVDDGKSSTGSNDGDGGSMELDEPPYAGPVAGTEHASYADHVHGARALACQRSFCSVFQRCCNAWVDFVFLYVSRAPLHSF
ncbi:hypothetical protein ACP70R_045420 [Stipagrostis hirtigluma subsp. patula]